MWSNGFVDIFEGRKSSGLILWYDVGILSSLSSKRDRKAECVR